MANMSTRVTKAWESLGGKIYGIRCGNVGFLRAWMFNTLVEVSSQLAPIVAEMRADRVWKGVVERPVSDFAVRRAAWEEFASALSGPPPSFDPVR